MWTSKRRRKVCAREGRDRRGLLELDDRGGDVALRDEELRERAARVRVARLEAHRAGERVDRARAVAELVAPERAEPLAQVARALGVAALGVSIDEARVDSLEIVPLREARAHRDERDERLFVRGIFFERGLEEAEAARLVAQAPERDVGLREAEQAALACVLGLGADRAERLDDLRPPVDVLVELAERSQHVEVVRAELARLLERVDRRARVGELGALDVGELLQLADADVVVDRGAHESLAKERDASEVLLAGREIDQREERGRVPRHERERLLVVRLGLARLALLVLRLGDAAVDARALELFVLGADHQRLLVGVEGVVERAAVSGGVAFADQLVELVECVVGHSARPPSIANLIG